MRIISLALYLCCAPFSVLGAGQHTAGACQASLVNSALKQTTVASPALGHAALGLSRQEALHLLLKHGYAVTRLAQDNEGIWLGEATRHNMLVDIAVDTAGNVITWR